MKNYWDVKEEGVLKAFLAEKKVEAEDKFEDEERREKWIDKCRKEFLRERRVLSVRTPIDGSYEGFAFDRAYMGKMGFGSPFVLVEEYGNKIMQMKRTVYLRVMYDKLIELVDDDVLVEKSVKNRADGTPGSEGMGMTCLFTLSNPTQEQRDSIATAVLQAAGRRGFLAKETLEGLECGREGSVDMDAVEGLENELHDLFNHLLGRFEKKEQDVRMRGRVCIEMDEEAKAVYKKLVKDNEKRYEKYIEEKVPSDKKNKVATLLRDMARKTLKLSVIFAVFNHGDNGFVVRKRDLEHAWAVVSRFFGCAKKFFDEDRHVRMLGLLAFLDGREVSAKELVDEGFFPQIRAYGRFQDEVKDVMLDYVKDFALEKGYELKSWKKKKADFYSLKKV